MVWNREVNNSTCFADLYFITWGETVVDIWNCRKRLYYLGRDSGGYLNIAHLNEMLDLKRKNIYSSPSPDDFL